ncbi:hypothetical protein Tco_1238430 [Tanacetum coccineum]
MPTTHVTEKDTPMPHDSPLPRVHSPVSDEGSLTLNELMVLCTSLSKKVESLESDLKQTKQTYGAAYTKLIMKEWKIAQIDEDEGITLVQMGARLRGGVMKILFTTASKGVSTAKAIPEEVSIAEPDMDVTLAEALVDLLKSGKKKSPKPKARAKDKGKAIMTEPEKPLKKKDQIQSDEELALRLHAEEQAEFERRQKERVAQEEASRAAIYEEIDNIQAMIEADEQLAVNSFVPMASDDKEKGSEKKAGGSRKKTLAKKRAGEKQSEESSKIQKIEDDAEKEELRSHLDIIPGDDVDVTVESLATNTKSYKIFTEMLDDFDRQDVLDLYRLVKERFKTTNLEGYDRLLWGDLITMFEPSKDDEVWKAQ